MTIVDWLCWVLLSAFMFALFVLIAALAMFACIVFMVLVRDIIGCLKGDNND